MQGITAELLERLHKHVHEDLLNYVSISAFAQLKMLSTSYLKLIQFLYRSEFVAKIHDRSHAILNG